MSGTRPADVLRYLDHPGTNDHAIVSRYCFHNDEAAFTEIVRRHGPVVWAACRRVAGNRADAEDAFQATFLVLVRRAAAIKNLDLLGNWLYGVAVRVAMKARRAAARRRRREVQVPTIPDPPSHNLPEASDLGPVIDEELAGLPAYYREAVVLCDLRGVSRPEAAKLLGIPEGTLSSRLAAGRKRLAARLAKRGVTLAAVAVPPVLANIARAAVPPELAARVTLQATTGAVPPAVVRLANEGFSVKTTLLMTVVLGSAIAGVVYAANPGENPPQPDPPKPPAVAKADPAAQPKPDPKAKDGDVLGFTTTPKLTSAFDLGLQNLASFQWNRDGSLLAVSGTEHERTGGKPDLKTNVPIIKVIPTGKGGGSWLTRLGPKNQLVGFSESGKGLVTAVREYDLISGRHELNFWEPEEEKKGVLTIQKRTRTADLDSTETHGYHFVPDGKTFRTIVYERPGGGAATKMDIQEVDATTGKTLKSVFKVDSDPLFRHYSQRPLSPDGKRLVVTEPGGKVVVYDVDRGAKLSEYKLVETPRVRSGPSATSGPKTDYLYMTFSPDGKRLVLSYGLGQTVVMNTDTGETLPPLEGGRMIRTVPGLNAFTGDDRLLALAGTRYVETKTKGKFGPDVGGEQTVYDPVGDFLTVWDTQTGKVLKSWAHRGKSTEVAFNPKRPLLAILEPNGEETRLGLWDFAAEAGKK